MVSTRKLRALFAVLAVSVTVFGCEHSTASTVPAARSSVSAVPSTTSSAGIASAAPAASATPVESASAAPASSAAASPPGDPLDGAPLLAGPDGKPLGQTEDKPKADSPALKRRLELLWQAIVKNDPAVAEPAFFPVVAYEQVKDIKNPAGDWKARLMRNFHRDVGEYHKKLGQEPEALRLVGLEIDEPRVKWMDRGKEGNKLGYFRVTRSKLRYADPAGKEHTLEVTSLISWRGEWFVVHLHGFK